jgi:hypothetical protein
MRSSCRITQRIYQPSCALRKFISFILHVQLLDLSSETTFLTFPIQLSYAGNAVAGRASAGQQVFVISSISIRVSQRHTASKVCVGWRLLFSKLVMHLALKERV